MSNKNADHYFLRGGGDMGELIRGKDWSKTSLGDPAHWPQSLCTMVAMMLDNPFGMYIAWGSEYIQLYNDGYRPILGATKHPQALGISTRETFSEIWHIIGSMFDDVMKGRAVGFPDFMLPLNRNGFVEECYFDFSYSPIRKDNGEVGGVLVTVIETTEKKRVATALNESNARYIDNILQAPVAMCIFRGENHVVEIANQQMLNLWGKQADEVLNKPIFEGLPEAKDQGLEELVDRVYATGEKFVANERPVDLPRNGKVETTYLNFVYDALKETDGTISGIVAIAVEVTSQVTARAKVEESEQKVRAVVENAPFPIAVYVGKEMIVELANQSIIDLWGKGNDVIGKSFKEVLPELANQLVFDQIQSVLTTGESFHTKNTPLDLFVDGKLITYYFNYSFTPLFDAAGSIYAVMNTGVDLTDLNLAKKRIEESEQRFQAAVSAVQGILWTNNAKGEMEGQQEGWSSLTGQDYEDYRGHGWIKAVHPDDAQPTLDAWNEAVKERRTFVFEHRAKTKEGQWRDFSVRAIPLVNADGTLRQWVGVHTDITEKKQAAKALKANEEKLTIVIEASELGTWEIDIETNIVTASDRFREIMGYQQKNTLTLNDTVKSIHSDYLQSREEAFEKAYDTGVFYFTGPIIWEDKSIHWIENKGKVFYDEDNNPVSIIGTTADITEEKEQQQILLESEQKFRLLADSMPQQIWTSDPAGNLNYYNQSVFDYSGLTLEKINKGGWIQIVHPDDREENIRQWVNAVSTGEDFLLEHRFRRYDGEYRWQLSRAIPQKDETGRIQMWVGTSTDIHEQKTFTKELELQVSERTKELEARNTELQKMNKELQSFAYISSHDLQEPLRKIQTFATRILEKEENNLSYYGKDMFYRIQNSAKRMQTLIQDLLAYSRTNMTERKLETTDLNKIIDEVKEDLHEELKEKHATIEAHQLCHADIIPFQFRQLMHNLIGNALKFSKPYRAPHIQIEAEIVDGLALHNPKLSPQNKYCHIIVSDNGIGFEQQYSEKIFEVFQRLHGKNEYKGTGIGLSIVKKIVENHNGIITATGELNKGATFDIFIPST